MTMFIDRSSISGYLLNRIQEDPRLAYHFDPITESMLRLTADYAASKGLNVDDFRRMYYAGLKFEAPMCRDCDN